MPTVVENPHCEFCDREIRRSSAPNEFAYLIAVYDQAARRFRAVPSQKYSFRTCGLRSAFNMRACIFNHALQVCQPGQYVLLQSGNFDPLRCWDHTGRQLKRFW